MKVTSGLSTQFGYSCHLSPLLARTTEIYTLSGGCLQMSQCWSWQEAVGRTVDPEPEMKFLFWFCR